MRRRRPVASLPDVRDGLTELERVVLVTLAQCQAERPGRAVPTALLYGRVVEHVAVTPDELVAVIARLSRR
jgi:hypothetical protein